MTPKSTSPDVLTDIRTTTLPSELSPLFTRYAELIGTRDRFLWKWIDQTSDLLTLSSVADDSRHHLRTQKLRSALFITLIDDFADRDYTPAVLHTATSLPLADTIPNIDVPAHEREHLHFAADVWANLVEHLPDAPRYTEFRTLFRNDVLEACKASEYGDLHTVDPAGSYYEYSLQYESPVMLLRPLVTLDLMYSPGFRWSDFPTVRQATTAIQPLFRIGNWLTTWEREFAEDDYANGVIARAIDDGVVSVADIQRLEHGADDEFKHAIAERIRQANIEEQLQEEWEAQYAAVTAQDWQADSVDVETYVTAIEEVFHYQQASQGVK